MAANSSVSDNNGEHDRLLRQRDLALGCAILAVAMTAVIFWRNFGMEYTELEAARQAVHQHRELLIQNQKAMKQVNSALLATRQAVEKFSQARRGSP